MNSVEIGEWIKMWGQGTVGGSIILSVVSESMLGRWED